MFKIALLTGCSPGDTQGSTLGWLKIEIKKIKTRNGRGRRGGGGGGGGGADAEEKMTGENSDFRIHSKQFLDLVHSRK